MKDIKVQHWTVRCACFSPFPIIDKEKKKIAYRDLTIFFKQVVVGYCQHFWPFKRYKISYKIKFTMDKGVM